MLSNVRMTDLTTTDRMRKPSNRRGEKGAQWKKHLDRDRKSKSKQSKRLDKVRVQVAFAHSLQDFLPAAFTTQQSSSAIETSTEPLAGSHLLNLPPELRTIIFEYVLQKPCTVWLYHRKTSWAGEHGLEQRYPLSVDPSLLRASRDIRREAFPVYFCINTFMLRTGLVAINHAASWLAAISQYCEERAFGGMQFCIDYASYSKIPQVEQLVQLLASGRLKLDVSGIDISKPVRKRGADQDDRLFQISDLNGGMYVQRALEEAALLGATARDQGWNRRKVAAQFQALLAQKMPLKHLRGYNRGKFRAKAESAVAREWSTRDCA